MEGYVFYSDWMKSSIADNWPSESHAETSSRDPSEGGEAPDEDHGGARLCEGGSHYPAPISIFLPLGLWRRSAPSRFPTDKTIRPGDKNTSPKHVCHHVSRRRSDVRSYKTFTPRHISQIRVFSEEKAEYSGPRAPNSDLFLHF